MQRMLKDCLKILNTEDFFNLLRVGFSYIGGKQTTASQNERRTHIKYTSWDAQALVSGTCPY